MNFLIDNESVFTLNETQENVLKNDINEDVFVEDMKRRITYIINEKYNQCFKRLKQEWDQKLIANNVMLVPTDPDEYAALVFSQPNYKGRKARDLEEEANVL